jgi:general secretion pathway protein J
MLLRKCRGAWLGPATGPAVDGFTLIEMLIALMIFGMITAAGVALLTTTVRTQEISDRLLDQLAAERRTNALLIADLGQAAPRAWRDADGRPRQAFVGGAGDQPLLLALVRRGWDEDGSAHGSVQRVEYRLRAGRLERWNFDAVDGDTPGIAATLLDNVGRVRLRYRDRRGDWHPNWDPTNPVQLPAAVELISESAGQGLVRALFLVGGTGR